MKAETYKIGKPCLNGHISERYVSNKVCVKCKKEKNIRFRNNNPECYEKQKEKAAARIKKLRRYKWFKNKEAAYQREWAKKNPDKIRAKKKAYRQTESYKEERKRRLNTPTGKISRREQKKRYLKTAGGKRLKAVAHANRRARKKKSEGGFTVTDIRIMLLRQKHKCAICKKSSVRKIRDIDHKTALCNGGSNLPDNLQLLCKPCHVEKTKRDYAIWLDNKKNLIMIGA